MMDRIAGVKDGAGAHSVEMTANSVRVLEARYLKRDEQGELLETPEDLLRRVARSVAQAETNYDGDPQVRSEWENRFFSLMASCRFMPNSPTLMNAGREMGMLSACFVLPVGDSINEIFDTIKHTALIQKAGGGTGFAFDRLRPTGDFIKSSGGTTSGPISFWRAFSEATNAIQQGAFRRGANMGMMNIDHPDILKFLHAKQDLSQFTNYNISVKATEPWMEARRAAPDSPHVVRNPRTGRCYAIPKDVDIWGYDIRALIPVEDQSVPTVDRPVYTKGDIWDIIIKNAWHTGEPGLVFIDRINQAHPAKHVGQIEATNPCGEQPLLPYEACNLGSVNLNRFILSGGTPQARVDWDALRETVHDAVRFLDDVIDVNNYPLPEIREICRLNRKIGLGIMGFADALYSLGAAYNSEEGVEWGERFMQFINEEAHNASEELASRRGCFPNWAGSDWDIVHGRKMRNACSTTVAPTGTISIIGGCSCGIEPLFGLVFFRNVLKGQDRRKTPMVEINAIFERVARERGILSEGLMERVAKDGTLAGVEGIPDDVRRVFVCAHDVTPEWHVRMQAAFQKHCDSSISKTINFPHSASAADVERIYDLCFDTGCKGITVYRDGCREEQPMAHNNKKTTDKAQGRSESVERPAASLRPALEPVMLPEITSAVRTRQMTPFGNMHIQITVDPKTERELEVFAQLGKGGDLANSDLEAICRMVSLWLRSGGALQQVVHQLKGIGSSLQVPTKEGKIMSLGDGLARALMKYERAKTRFGLKALLLGDFDPADLDREVISSVRKAHAGDNGNGNGNGSNGTGHRSNGNGHGPKPAGLPESATQERHGEIVHPPAVDKAAGGRPSQPEVYKVVCPECQDTLVFSEGCRKCISCGFSAC